MLVHIVVSCDDNPFLDPGLRVASLHSLQNVEKWMNDKKSNQIVLSYLYLHHSCIENSLQCFCTSCTETLNQIPIVLHCLTHNRAAEMCHWKQGKV